MGTHMIGRCKDFHLLVFLKVEGFLGLIGGGGTWPGQGSGGHSAPPAPPQHIISQYQQALSQPQSMQSLISGQGVGGGHQTVQFAAGCNRRWTIVLLRNGQVF